MNSYRLLYFDHFRLLGGEEFEAANDVHAIGVAFGKSRGRQWELWSDHRRIEAFTASHWSPSTAADIVSAGAVTRELISEKESA